MKKERWNSIQNKMLKVEHHLKGGSYVELELTQIQKDILYALISLYNKTRYQVKGGEIAKLLDRDSISLRHNMQVLKALGLVEGIPGLKGGYRPTVKAYEILSITMPENAVGVPVIKNDELLDDLTVEEISFPSVSHPEVCQVKIRMVGDVRRISVGDSLLIGPTPVNGLIIAGKVRGRDDTTNSIIMESERIIAIPKGTISKPLSKPITVDRNTSIKEVAKILNKREINCILVKEGDAIVGFFTCEHAVNALAEGKIDEKVEDLMEDRIVMVEKDTTIREAIRLMKDKDVEILIVTEKNRSIGALTVYEICSYLIKLAERLQYYRVSEN